VTVAAIDAVVAYVVFMAELDRLLAFEKLPGVPCRAIEFDTGPKRSRCDKNSSIDRDLR
jgi:hypothetical protein